MKNPVSKYQSRKFSPIASRILCAHEANVNKQLRAQRINQSIIEQYEERKKKHRAALKEKQEKIASRLMDNRRKNEFAMKTQSENMKKVVQKYKRMQEAMNDSTIAMFHQRNSNERKNQHTSSSEASVEINKEEERLAKFYQQKFSKTVNFSLELMNKSMEKQKKAEMNRLHKLNTMLNEDSKQKIFKRLRAIEANERKERKAIYRSVEKLESIQKWQQERNRSIDRKIKQQRLIKAKHLQKIKKSQENIEFELNEKSQRLQRVLEQKNSRCIQNKENHHESSASLKTQNRIKFFQLTQCNLERSKQNFAAGMNEIYKKDREQWAFVTGFSSYKQNLIQKNIYESTKISLLK